MAQYVHLPIPFDRRKKGFDEDPTITNGTQHIIKKLGLMRR
jgi:hypothetical protein